MAAGRQTLALAGLLLLAPAQGLAADRRPLDDPKFAQKAFATADKNNDGGLDERELREALRIVRSALVGASGSDLPGGKSTAAKLEEMVSKARPDADGDGRVNEKEFNDLLAQTEKRARAIIDAEIDRAKEAARKAQQQQEQAGKQKRKAEDKARREARSRAKGKARRMAR